MKTSHLRALLCSALLAASASAMALPSGGQVDSAIASGDFKGAESMLRQVVAAKPASAKAWVLLAETEAKLGNRDLDSQALDKARAINPDARSLAPDAFDAASSYLASAQIVKTADSGQPMPTSAQVEAAIRSQNWRGAEGMLETVVAAKPNNAKAWYYLAQVEEKLGNAGRASTALSRATTVDPSLKFASPDAVQAMQRRLGSTAVQAPAYHPQALPGYANRPAVGATVAVEPSLPQQPEKPSSHAWVYILLLLAIAAGAGYYFYSKKGKQKELEAGESARKALLNRANNVHDRAAKLVQTAHFEGQEASQFAVAATALLSKADTALGRMKPMGAALDLRREEGSMQSMESSVEALETQAQRKAWDEALAPAASPAAAAQSTQGSAPAQQGYAAQSAASGFPQQGPAYGAPGYAAPGYGAPVGGQTVIVENNNSGSGLLETMIVADAIRENHRERDYDMQRQMEQDRGRQSNSGGGYAAPEPAPAPAPSSFDLGGSGGGWDQSASPAPAPDASWDDAPSPAPAPDSSWDSSSSDASSSNAPASGSNDDSTW